MDHTAALDRNGMVVRGGKVLLLNSCRYVKHYERLAIKSAAGHFYTCLNGA